MELIDEGIRLHNCKLHLSEKEKIISQLEYEVKTLKQKLDLAVAVVHTR